MLLRHLRRDTSQESRATDIMGYLVLLIHNIEDLESSFQVPSYSKVRPISLVEKISTVCDPDISNRFSTGSDNK